MGKSNKTKTKPKSNILVANRRAKFNYHLGDTFVAGMVLLGWEVKSLRAGKGHLTDCYVRIIKGEAWVLGMHIDPLPNAAANHKPADATRDRKLLLQQRELKKLIGSVQSKGTTCIASAVILQGARIKCRIHLATGKKQHDKRATNKERDWNRQQQIVQRRGSRNMDNTKRGDV